jgi:type VI secretion system protein VasD
MNLGRVLRSALGATLVAAAAASVLGIACSQPVPPKEPEACKLQRVSMTIIASPRINQADNGDARPVQVRIYQLATDVRLNNASFHDVWKDDKTALKDDLVKNEELSVYPDSRTDITFERDEKAMTIGAVALFRNPKGRSWYTTFELPPSPGKGSCGQQTCPDGGCPDAGPKLNPVYVVWIDGSRVDEGSDHIDDYPQSGRRVEAHLPFAEPTDQQQAEKSQK